MVFEFFGWWTWGDVFTTAIIREFSIAVNVPLVNVVERMSARNVGSTAHYVFVH